MGLVCPSGPAKRPQAPGAHPARPGPCVLMCAPMRERGNLPDLRSLDLTQSDPIHPFARSAANQAKQKKKMGY